MRHVKCLVGLAAVMVLGLWQSAVFGQSATGTVEQLSPTLYQYDLTLDNTTSTPIESFWFGWLPGYDLLPHIPSSVSSPSGWSGTTMEEGIGGSSVLWTSPTGLQPGHSQDGFIFQTSDSPTVLEADSPFFIHLPADFAYTYSIVVTPASIPPTGGTLTPSPFVVIAPEPGCLLLVPAAFLLVHRRRAR